MYTYVGSHIYIMYTCVGSRIYIMNTKCTGHRKVILCFIYCKWTVRWIIDAYTRIQQQ